MHELKQQRVNKPEESESRCDDELDALGVAHVADCNLLLVRAVGQDNNLKVFKQFGCDGTVVHRDGHVVVELGQAHNACISTGLANVIGTQKELCAKVVHGHRLVVMDGDTFHATESHVLGCEGL